jgi:hypothetical protein
MPGPYAHITLLHVLMRPDRADAIFSPESGLLSSLTAYFPYCCLGAVSPDYPNLAWRDGVSPRWADAMHGTRACDMITSGISRVRNAGAARDKLLAWLLGYAAHVATDVTIHPVVQSMVGPYAENQRQHRVCEMNQDSYIYRRMKLGEIGESDSFARDVAMCSDAVDKSGLDRDIAALWEGMLADVYPELWSSHPTDCSAWHREFVGMVAGSADQMLRLFPLAGTIAAKMNLTYPTFDLVDRQFIQEQFIPSERPLYLHYDDVFDHAADNVVAVWNMLEQALCDDDPTLLPLFGEWNLDDGCDERGRLVFWE